MVRIRKSALLLLVLVVTWTMTPLLTCALAPGRAHMPACCRAMAQHCDQATGMSGVCCTAQKPELPATPVTTLSLESSHEAAFMPVGMAPQTETASTAELRSADLGPLPDTSPGRTSILRI
jgi:hypothetical protein